MNSTSLEQTIQQLKPSTNYEFRVVAWNSHGHSRQAARTELVTLPEGMCVVAYNFCTDVDSTGLVFQCFCDEVAV